MKHHSIRFWSLVLTAGLLLASCANGPDASRRKVVIRFENAETLPQQLVMMKEIISEFEMANPDVRIKLVAGFGNLAKILTEIAGGDAPDVFMWWQEPSDLTYRDALLPLDDYIAKYRIDTKSYWPCLVDMYTYDGKLMAMPLQLKSVAVVYNKDLFDQEGLAYPNGRWSWNDYYETARKLKKDKNGDRIIDQWGSLLPYPSYMIFMNGGRFIDEQKKVCTIARDPKSLDALRFWLKLGRDGCPSKSEEDNAVSGLAGTSGFLTGKIGMVLAPSWMLASFQTINSFEWRVAPAPSSLDGQRHEIFEGAALCISRQTRHPDEAFRFAAFYCGPKGMEICAKYKNGIPALKSTAYAQFLAGSDGFLRPYVEAGERASVYASLKYIANPQEFWTMFNEQMDRLRLEQATLDQALRELTLNVDAKLKTLSPH
jgi:multiple sugar transport system substrate-binding protein